MDFVLCCCLLWVPAPWTCLLFSLGGVGEGVVGRWVYAVGLAWIGHCFAAQPGYLLRVLWTFWLFSADGRSKNFHVHTVHVRLSGNSRFAAKHHDV